MVELFCEEPGLRHYWNFPRMSHVGQTTFTRTGTRFVSDNPSRRGGGHIVSWERNGLKFELYSGGFSDSGEGDGTLKVEFDGSSITYRARDAYKVGTHTVYGRELLPVLPQKFYPDVKRALEAIWQEEREAWEPQARLREARWARERADEEARENEAIAERAREHVRERTRLLGEIDRRL